MPFNAATLIALKGENNLDAWARALKVEHASQGLKLYVTKTIPEPKVDDKTKDKDEKYLFDFIRNSISSVTNDAKSDVLDEYQTIKCSSFATLEAFLMRWQTLRKRVKDVGYIIDDKVELTNLFNAVKRSFPHEAMLWAADMNKNELTTMSFLARLSTLANTQKNYTNMVAAKLEVKTKETKEIKTESNGDERVACNVCGKKVYKGLKHFSCGHHRVPGTPDCWWCDPDKAPDTWINKKNAMGYLNKNTGGTTAAVAGNNSNINNPPTALTASSAINSNLLFGLGGLSFDDDWEEEDFH
ncbi:hypothetical protein SMAC4_09717 [Sordaria macrospora]|nr:hypothetical protein SMAC4_09717 [Sordaria macrospora]